MFRRIFQRISIRDQVTKDVFVIFIRTLVSRNYKKR